MAAVIIEDPDDDLDTRMRTAALAVLGEIQDSVSTALKKPWPPAQPYGALPPPGAHVDATRLTLWYGDEHAPQLELAPINKAELLK
ncbi:hypothetical protein GCM10010187_22460 [Actinomadura coerulea]|nr:hypothetical protein GCM10010187_22460 [Actinomadura coerulea]